jgi:hypothetical protein
VTCLVDRSTRLWGCSNTSMSASRQASSKRSLTSFDTHEGRDIVADVIVML